MKNKYEHSFKPIHQLLNTYKNHITMKRNKNYFSIIGIVLACGVLITSCADNFDEEELLLRQQERSDRIAAQEAAEEAADEAAEEVLSAANAAALAAAANLTYTITLHSDDLPVADADVLLTNQNGGSTAAVTTDANGNAIFTDIDLGGYNVAISSDNHLNASYLVDFGSPQDGVHYEWVNGSIVALEQSEASKIELLELNGTQTATIKGNVEIETDLTNTTPEVPLDITIRANLDNFNGLFEHTNNSFNGSNSASTFYINGSYSLTEGDIGSADVDPNTGAYSMMVPAQEDGTTIELLFPLVETDQTLGFSSVNGQDVGAQVGTQAAVFGPDITASATPNLGGVVAQFPEPEAPGRGFSVGNFERMPADINAGNTFNEVPYSINGFPLDAFSGSRTRGNQGSGYLLTPTVTASAPDLMGSNAENITIEAWMNWTLESVAYAAQPALTYGPNELITISLEISDVNGVQDIYDLATINAGVAGDLVADSVDVDPLLLMAPGGGNVITTNYVVTSFNIVFTGNQANNPSGTLTRSGSVDLFRVINDGEGYTNIPIITVGAAPNGGTNASLEIYEMSFRYSFDLDNSGVTQGYVVLPEITFELETVPGAFNPSTSVILTTLDADGFIDLSEPQDPLTDGLMVSNGNLVFDDDLFSANVGAVTTVDKGLTGFSYSEPSAIIVEPTHEQTTADVDVNNDGEITGLSNISVGSGYTSEYDVTLVTQNGLPGAGAVIDLVDFDTDSDTGEVTWGGNANDFIVVEPGSGYTEDVNISVEVFSATTSVTVRNGETKILNVNYGTGDRVSDVN